MHIERCEVDIEEVVFYESLLVGTVGTGRGAASLPDNFGTGSSALRLRASDLATNLYKGRTVYKGRPAGRPARRKGRTAAYVELLGNGVFYSLNVDYRSNSTNCGVRAGIGSLRDALTAPAMFYCLYGTKHSLELGAGVGIYDFDGVWVDGGLWGTATIGYRYQPAEGFLFRIGFTPIVRPGGEGRQFLPWGGLSFGVTF